MCPLRQIMVHRTTVFHWILSPTCLLNKMKHFQQQISICEICLNALTAYPNFKLKLLSSFSFAGVLGSGMASTRSEESKNTWLPSTTPFSHLAQSSRQQFYTYHARAWWNVQERAGGCEGLGGERLQVHTSKTQPWKGFQDNKTHPR